MTHADNPDAHPATTGFRGSAFADPSAAPTGIGERFDNGLFAPDPGGNDPFGEDPFGDDLAEKLAARAVSPRARRATTVLGGLVLVVAGFLGGVLVQQNFGATTATTGSGNVPGALPSGFRAGGFGQVNGGNAQGGSQGAGSSTTGTVKLVDGTTIYLTTADGQVVTVKTTTTTSVTTEQATALKDLKAGATVTVRGTANSDGVITASQVTATKK